MDGDEHNRELAPDAADVDDTLVAVSGKGAGQAVAGASRPTRSSPQGPRTTIPRSGGLAPEDSFASLTPEAEGRYSAPPGAGDDEELGRGGIGRVLLVLDRHLGRQVAVKELLGGQRLVSGTAETGAGGGGGDGDDASRTSPTVARFLREARVTGQLEHPNIVPVYELGTRPDGTLYYTMKLVRGRTLAEALRSCTDLAGRLDLLGHYVDLCQAIAYAHSRGVIHRDIKTDNVMLGEFGETVVLDWGLAKVKGERDLTGADLQKVRTFEDTGDAGLTSDGALMGTPAYMSPEQAEGTLESIDERSDVWSLGAVLYEILTGRPPFLGETVLQVLLRVLSQPVPPPEAPDGELPPELVAICHKALEREREKRYASARGLAADVGAFLSGARVASYRYTSWELVKRFVRRNPALTALVGALALVLVVGSGLVYRAYGQAEQARAAAERERGVAVRARHAAEEARGLAERRQREAQGNLAAALAEKAEGLIIQQEFLAARLLSAHALRLASADDGSDPSGAGAAGPPGGARSPSPEDAEDRVAPAVLARVRGALGRSKAEAALSLERRLSGHRGRIGSLAVAPDGDRFATIGDDGTLRIWRLTTGANVLEWSIPERQTEGGAASYADAKRRLTFTRDSEALLLRDCDGTVRRIDLTGTVPTEELLLGGLEASSDLCHSPRTGLLAVTEADGQILLYDVDARRALLRLPAVPASSSLVACSPDGRVLIRAMEPGTFAAIDTTTGQERWRGRAKEGRLYDFAFSPDGQRLAVGTTGFELSVFDVESGRRLADQRTAYPSVQRLAFSRDGLLILAIVEGNLAVYESASLAPLASVNRSSVPDTELQCSLSADRCVSIGRSDDVWVWRVRARPPAALLRAHDSMVTSLAISPDGRLLVSADWRGAVLLWDLEQRRVVRRLSEGTENYWTVRFRPDGEHVLTLDLLGNLAVYAVDDGRLIRSHRSSGGGRGLVNLPGGTQLATSSDDGRLQIWSWPELKLDGDRRTTMGELFGLDVSPDGSTLACAGLGGVELYRRADLEPIRRLVGHDGLVSWVAFDRSGTRLVSSGIDATVRLWDANTGRAIRTLRGHEGWTNKAVFSPDGKRVLSVGDDRAAWLWDAESGRPLAVHRTVGASVAAAFSPDGRSYAFSDDASIIVMPTAADDESLSPDHEVEEAMRESGLRLDGFGLRLQ